MENIVNLTKINKINKVMWHVNLFSWIEIRRWINIFLNAYLKTISNKYKKNILAKNVFIYIYFETCFSKHIWPFWYLIYNICIYIYIYIHTHALWSPELNRLTRETRSEAPNWLAKRALKPRPEPIDSRNALWSPELNQLTREKLSEARF